MDGFFFSTPSVSMVIFFRLTLSPLCLWWSERAYLYLRRLCVKVICYQETEARAPDGQMESPMAGVQELWN